MEFRGIMLGKQCASTLRLIDRTPLFQGSSGTWLPRFYPMALGISDRVLQLLLKIGAVELSSGAAAITADGRAAVKRDNEAYFGSLCARRMTLTLPDVA